jgi:hypothetical protein
VKIVPSTSYPTGGEPLDFAANTHIEVLHVGAGVANGGYVTAWDEANQKLKIGSRAAPLRHAVLGSSLRDDPRCEQAAGAAGRRPWQARTPETPAHMTPLDEALERQRAAGQPMRAIILKARKLGFSTWVQAKLCSA